MTTMTIPVTTTIATSLKFQTRLKVKKSFFWNLVAGSTFKNVLNNVYEKIAHRKKNIFMLPSGAAGKTYVEEVKSLMKVWTQDTPLKSISLKDVHVMPALLLQKPSKSFKRQISSPSS